VYDDNPWDPKIMGFVRKVVVAQRSFMHKKLQMGPYNGGRYSEVVISSGLTVYTNIKGILIFI
jgi:hypothetical protein